MAAAPQSTGMDKAEMRKMLTATKEKPVHCAIGVGKDQSVGLLVMDKLKLGKMLEKKLIDDLPDAKNTRWGTAQVDWENDHKLVKLFLNKPISGMARRLVKTIKGTGFSKVQIMMEDGTPVENAAGEDEEEGVVSEKEGGEGVPQTEVSVTPGTPPPPPPPPVVDKPVHDAAELTRRLAALAPRIPQVAGDNAERKAELLKLASLGNVNIKTNNLTYAATYIGQLEQALAVPTPPPPPPPPETPTQDAGALSRELATLIPRVAQLADATQKAELSKLANLVNVNIKTNNLTYAATYLAQLKTGLEKGAGPTPTPTPGTAPPDKDKLQGLLVRLTLQIPRAADGNDALQTQWSGLSDEAQRLLGGDDLAAASAAVERLRVAMMPALQKLQQTAKESGAYDQQGKQWADARATVEEQLGKLRSAILAAYQDQPFLGEVATKFNERTGPVLSKFDLGFTTKLAEVAKAADAAQRTKLIDEAHGLLDGYRAYAADPLLADLDDNPFVPLSIQGTVLQAVDGLARALH